MVSLRPTAAPPSAPARKSEALGGRSTLTTASSAPSAGIDEVVAERRAQKRDRVRPVARSTAASRTIQNPWDPRRIRATAHTRRTFVPALLRHTAPNAFGESHWIPT